MQRSARKIVVPYCTVFGIVARQVYEYTPRIKEDGRYETRREKREKWKRDKRKRKEEDEQWEREDKNKGEGKMKKGKGRM